MHSSDSTLDGTVEGLVRAVTSRSPSPIKDLPRLPATGSTTRGLFTQIANPLRQLLCSHRRTLRPRRRLLHYISPPEGKEPPDLPPGPTPTNGVKLVKTYDFNPQFDVVGGEVEELKRCVLCFNFLHCCILPFSTTTGAHNIIIHHAFGSSKLATETNIRDAAESLARLNTSPHHRPPHPLRAYHAN